VVPISFGLSEYAMRHCHASIAGAFSHVHSAAPAAGSVVPPSAVATLVSHIAWYFDPSLATTARPPDCDTISQGPTEFSHVPNVAALAGRGIAKAASATALNRQRMLTSVGHRYTRSAYDTPGSRGVRWR
jgi:hypothetical protein